ncbi:MAG: NAD-dependent epimerase/dehydratase family protein [Anaerolineae bacterium]|jgi:NADH dehydrogenase
MILVTGATNFVGRSVVRQLSGEGRDVCCLIQSSQFEQQLPRDVLFPLRSASLGDVSALLEAMERVTVIIHLSREEDRPRERGLAHHVEGTRNLLRAAQEAGVSRFIYLSRLGATPASAYPVFSIRGESEIAVAESGLDYTTLRSAVIYGAEDLFTTRLVMLAKMSPLILPIPDVGMVRFQPLWVEDLTRCIVATIDRNDLVDRVIPVGGPEHFTLEQMIRRVLEAAGMRRHLFHLSMPLMGTGAELLEALLVQSPAPRWWLDLAAVGSATELGTIPKRFGFEPCRLAHCLNYLRRRRPWRRLFIRHVLGR